MWIKANAFLKQRLPHLHSWMKKAWMAWLDARNGFPPVPKRVAGSLMWIHPRLLTSDTINIQPLVFHWIDQRLQPESIFFDVGAHYGWMSIKAAKRVGSVGRVVAFEPAPVLVGLLNYHKKFNRLSQLTIIPKAVADREGESAPFFF